MKKISVFLVMALLGMSVLFAGCGSESEGRKNVAVTFANSSASWQRNGNTIKKTLEEEGFAVDLQFADNEQQQIDQLKGMIEAKPRCIVIGAVNSGALSEVLKEAKAQQIPVIAYDRLVMNTDAVSYYASYDNEGVGQAMGEYIEAALKLKSGAGPFNIEVFAGDSGDNNAKLFFSGAMDVLKPYFDKGQLICPSGETSFDRVMTKDWDPKNAQARMEKIMADNYRDGKQLHAVLSPNDGCAVGIVTALAASGYAGPQPILTGQDADAAALDNIRQGKQTITIYKDPSLLTVKCVRMIKAVVEGVQPDINDVKTYNNRSITVPSYLCTPYIVDKDNLDIVK